MVGPDIPSHVLKSFGVTGNGRPLAGGQGSAVLYGNIVLKPCENPTEWTGLAPIVSGLQPMGYRTAKPVCASDGRWVVDGWMATHLVDGTPGYAGREAEALSACRSFHREMAQAYESSSRPSWLGSGPTVYSRADQLAWGELPLTEEFDPSTTEKLIPIGKRARPIHLLNQITHGDPGGDNILFKERHPPAIIDIAPYWRPAGYAIAMMLADGIAWEGSESSTLVLAQDEPYIGQLLIRAIIFRLCVSALLRGPSTLDNRIEAYSQVTEWALSHV